jgi:hypothetical protein
MKTIRVLALGLSAMMVLSLAGSAFAGERGRVVNHRQTRQSNRIEQGIHSGELTRKEAKNLAQGEHRINRYEKVARADGHISPKEFHKLEQMQDHESKAIYKQKHDNQDRSQ